MHEQVNCARCTFPNHATWIVGCEIDEIYGAFEEVCAYHIADAGEAVIQSTGRNGRLELQAVRFLA